MPQNYRIYINENSLLIGKKTTLEGEKVQQLDSQNFDFLSFYKNLKKDGSKHYCIQSSSPKEIFQSVKKACVLIKAAGGLVENSKGKQLFIFRNNKWDLPKGKVEKREKLKVTAVREVEEECGIKVNTLGKKLCRTYHIYFWDAKLVLKKTNWYSMTVTGTPKLKPQKEEGITSAVWVEKTKIKSKLKNTYPLILDVLRAAKLLK